MATYPLKTAISDTYPNPSNATARTGFGALWDYSVSIPHGQCRLVKSGANLVLQRYNGQWLRINDVAYSIPAAGVSLSASGLTPSTIYNIYAYMSGATMTLEASTTAHTADSTTGVEIKSGDATRTLVGKAQVITGPAWVDTDSQRYVISWFNRRPLRIYNIAAGGAATTSATPVGIIAQANFLAWGDYAVPASFVGSVSNSTINQACYTALGFDTSSAFSHAPVLYQAYANSTQGAAVGSSTFVPSEGAHYIITLGQVSGGTGTWQANIEMSGLIQG